MKKAKTFIKNNIKFLVGFILGSMISAGGVYAAIVIQGSSVGYTDNNGIGATTVQGAIDNLYTKATNWSTIYYLASTKKFTYVEPSSGNAVLYIKLTKGSDGMIKPQLCIYSSTSKKRACGSIASQGSTHVKEVGGTSLGSGVSQYGGGGAYKVDGVNVSVSFARADFTMDKINNKSYYYSAATGTCKIQGLPVQTASGSSQYYADIQFGCS